MADKKKPRKGGWRARFRRKSPRKQSALERKLRATLRNVNTRIRRRRRRNLSAEKLVKQRENLQAKVEFLEEQQDDSIDADGFATWKDGTKVAPWMVGLAPGPDGRTVNWLQRYVDHGWDGNLSSGGRSPEYSESLCRRMCGAPSCPGRCAGRASNHSGNGKDFYPGTRSINWGAIDVYPEYAEFERIGMRIGSPLINRLDYRDPVHFSVTGN